MAEVCYMAHLVASTSVEHSVVHDRIRRVSPDQRRLSVSTAPLLASSSTLDGSDGSVH